MGKNNRKKQGSFFQSLFQVPSFNIRDFRASSTDKEAFSLLFGSWPNYRVFLPFLPPARRAWSQAVACLIENSNIILTTCIEKIERYLLKIRLNVY